jgi:glyoxylase-like metal-dependent hydrolase (beta-lactamase superfamily II)
MTGWMNAATSPSDRNARRRPEGDKQMDSPEQLMPGVWRFADTCNVYVIASDKAAIAIDFGSGGWMDQFDQLGLPPIEHVFLTHHHAEQCHGLNAGDDWPFVIHAPAGERDLLTPAGVKDFGRTRRGGGTPSSYDPLDRGIEGIRYDMGGFADVFWHDQRIRLIDTPGHGRGALSIVLDHRGKQLVFCGDAAHDGATLWQPYHLEWDHWTGSGALAAWEGIQRLSNIGMDLLCPSHGPIIAKRPRAMLSRLGRKLLAMYHAKGNICPGEKDRYVTAALTPCGARRVLPDLYQFGANAYLLTSRSGQAMILDVQASELAQLAALLAELGDPNLTTALASHFHCDHSDGLLLVRKRYGANVCLHPDVAEPLREIGAIDAPWLPAEPIVPDQFLPADGQWQWHEYAFRVGPLPTQTRWHCALMTTIAGQRVLFGGDGFQTNSRWNGTGGFCAFNGSDFLRGFVPSAQRIIDWDPHLLANAHGVYYRYRRSQFEKIIRWAEKADAAVTALCPSGNLDTDYYLHAP